VQILVLIGLYFLKCTKFDQLILRNMIKIVATRCQIFWLKCTKFDFGWGLDMGVAEFKSARRWKNKSHSPPRRSSSESNLVFPSEVT